jgi:hypothetical protein
MFFLRLLIINFVINVYESPHDEINGGIFILHVFAYFDYKNTKNECFIVYFVINIYNQRRIYLFLWL